MNEPMDAPIDKSTWGDGPWQTEPDRVEWRHAGLPCLAHRGPMGNWCGYAAVPPGHPLHGTAYPDADVSVHGGLTYSDRCSGAICHVPNPGEPDDVWWFGWDCGHAWDFSPALAAQIRGANFFALPFLLEPYDHAAAMAADPSSPTWPWREIYRTLDYVQAETNRLAEQLAAVVKPITGAGAHEDLKFRT